MRRFGESRDAVFEEEDFFGDVDSGFGRGFGGIGGVEEGFGAELSFNAERLDVFFCGVVD